MSIIVNKCIGLTPVLVKYIENFVEKSIMAYVDYISKEIFLVEEIENEIVLKQKISEIIFKVEKNIIHTINLSEVKEILQSRK